MSAHEAIAPGPYGLVAEFDTPEQLLDATRRTRAAGYRHFEAYTPFPIHGLPELVTKEDHRLKWLIFFGGIAGVAAGYGLQYWVTVIAYPHNVGGKPMHSWPAFIPVTFECMVLIASFSALLGMLALNGLPKPYHPIFNARNFERASRDKFFLCIESEDAQFDVNETRRFLERLNPAEVSEVEA